MPLIVLGVVFGLAACCFLALSVAAEPAWDVRVLKLPRRGDVGSKGAAGCACSRVV